MVRAGGADIFQAADKTCSMPEMDKYDENGQVSHVGFLIAADDTDHFFHYVIK